MDNNEIKKRICSIENPFPSFYKVDYNYQRQYQQRRGLFGGFLSNKPLTPKEEWIGFIISEEDITKIIESSTNKFTLIPNISDIESEVKALSSKPIPNNSKIFFTKNSKIIRSSCKSYFDENNIKITRNQELADTVVININDVIESCVIKGHRKYLIKDNITNEEHILLLATYGNLASLGQQIIVTNDIDLTISQMHDAFGSGVASSNVINTTDDKVFDIVSSTGAFRKSFHANSRYTIESLSDSSYYYSYYIESKEYLMTVKNNIITDDDLYKVVNESSIIDYKAFMNLYKMFISDDPAIADMGLRILCTSNIEKSIVYVALLYRAFRQELFGRLPYAKTSGYQNFNTILYNKYSYVSPRNADASDRSVGYLKDESKFKELISRNLFIIIGSLISHSKIVNISREFLYSVVSDTMYVCFQNIESSLYLKRFIEVMKYQVDILFKDGVFEFEEDRENGDMYLNINVEMNNKDE